MWVRYGLSSWRAGRPGRLLLLLPSTRSVFSLMVSLMASMRMRVQGNQYNVGLLFRRDAAGLDLNVWKCPRGFDATRRYVCECVFHSECKIGVERCAGSSKLHLPSQQHQNSTLSWSKFVVHPKSNPLASPQL